MSHNFYISVEFNNVLLFGFQLRLILLVHRKPLFTFIERTTHDASCMLMDVDMFKFTAKKIHSLESSSNSSPLPVFSRRMLWIK